MIQSVPLGRVLVFACLLPAGCQHGKASPPTETSTSRDSSTSPDSGASAVSTLPNSAPHVSRDANGWTVVTPSADSRVVYVSSSVGKDSNSGLSDSSPVKTLKKGASLLRPGYPDHLLLRSGDVWHEEFGAFEKIGGRSADEPLVFTSYGSGARPQIQPTGADIAFGHMNKDVSAHFYLIGIDFYDGRKDPSSPNYQAKAQSIDAISWLDGGDDLLIEDCSIRFFGDGIVVQTDQGPTPTNVRIRRNLIADTYSATGLPQGLYFGRVNNALIEENIFEHNGWNEQAGAPATVFAHHLYMSSANTVTVRGNLFLRAASLDTKFRSDTMNGSTGMLIENNLIFEGEVGLTIACGAPSQGPCFTNYTVQNNVLLQINRDNPTGRDLGWGMVVGDVSGAVFKGNIFSDISFTGNTVALNLAGNDDTSVTTEITLQDNLVYRVASAGFMLESRPLWANIKVVNNTLQDPDLGSQLVLQQGPFAPFQYSGNTYFTTNDSGFAWVGKVDGATGKSVSYNQWVSQSGETNSQNQAVSYSDPRRTLETYQKSLGGQATLSDFLASVRAQSKASWNTAYTAATINNYIRAGFNLPTL